MIRFRFRAGPVVWEPRDRPAPRHQTLIFLGVILSVWLVTAVIAWFL